jgi:hypothetical protein
MTSQSPRIYIYKITFEEVLYYYYGVHKEKRFNDYYMGSPITHKWMWDFYTPKKQILQFFEFNDEGWLEAQEIEGKAVNLFVKSENTKVQFQLADLAVIPNVPDLKKLPDFDVDINFDGAFIDKFIKAKNALSDVDTFTILTEKKELKVVLGYSNINSNRVVFVVDKAYAGDVKPISFSAKYLKEILTANKEATAVVLKVSTQGISHVEFKIDDFTAKYYLVEQQLTA